MTRRRGFTLIELTIAIVLLAVGLLALTGALARALHETVRARTLHAALREAQGVADSAAANGIATAGSIARPGFVVQWRPEPCALGTCVRLVAVVDGDTVALLARTGP